MIISSASGPAGVPEAPAAPADAKDPELSFEEMVARRPERRNGPFFATLTNVNFASSDEAALHYGAGIATRRLMQGIIRHGNVRRWFLVRGRDETYPADRALDRVLLEHAVPAPVFSVVGAAECARLVQGGFVHAFFAPHPLEAGHLLLRQAARAPRVPYVALVHDLPGPTARWLALCAGPSYAHDALIVPSECGRKAVRAHLDAIAEAYGRPAFLGDIVQIPYGVDTSPLAVDRKTAREELGWSESETVLLSVARIDRAFKYDPSPLLLVFSLLCKRYPERRLRLVLAGSAQELDLQQVEAEAQALGLGERVELRPNFSSRSKDALYAGADVFIAFSDNVQETHGLAVLEAMRAALPVVAAEWNGYRETVRDGETGYLVATRMLMPDDPLEAAASVEMSRPAPGFQVRLVSIDLGGALSALSRLVEDPAERRRLGENGRARVLADFDEVPLAKRTAEVIAQRADMAEVAKLTPSHHFGSNWARVYAHYPSEVLGDATPISAGVLRLAELTEATRHALGVSGRATVLELLAVAAEETSSHATLGELARAVQTRCPRFEHAGIMRWLVRASKYGLFSLGAKR